MSKGTTTRQTILEQGVALASLRGLGGVSIGALADAVGMSKSGLYAHFKSKEMLETSVLQAAVDRFVDEVIAPALKAPRGEPRVRSLFTLWLAWDHAAFMPGGCLFVNAAVELADAEGPARGQLVRHQRDLIDTLTTAVRIAQDEGHFRANLDPRQFALEMYALVFGYHFISRLLRDPNANASAQAALERLISDAHA